jgi:hypothetical protein
VICCQVIRVLHFASRTLASGNEVRDDHDQRNQQQDMDYSSQGVAGYEAEQP